MATVEELKTAILDCTEEELANMAIVLNKAICVRLKQREFQDDRKTEAIGRLQAWVRDFGDEKQPAFIADLKTVLEMK